MASVVRTFDSSTLRQQPNLTGCSPSGKPSKQRIVQVLLNLYDQKDNWRKYGKLKPHCRDTIIVSPVNLWWWMTQIFIIVTVTTFTYKFFFLNWIAIVPAIVISILEWMAFYKTCLRDPGVMQRPDFYTALRNLMKVLSTWEHDGTGLTRLIIHSSSGSNEQVNFCWRCNHFRAVSTCHCSVCDCCMIQHDHHCPVFGGCVAKNNLSSFHTMAISMACFWIYVFSYNIYHLTTSEMVTNSMENQLHAAAARDMFFLLLGEVLAVITVPVTVKCCRKLLKTAETQNVFAPKSKYGAQDVLKFAKENNLPYEEEVQLREFFQTDTETRRSGSHQTKDLNHNNQYFASTTDPTGGSLV